MARNGQVGWLAKSARTLNNAWASARSGKKKPQPRTVGVSLLVVGRNLAPNLSNSAPYNRFELLRKGAESSPCCWQSYQFPPAVGISDAPETSRQFDSHLRN